MILADTSVLVSYFRGSGTDPCAKLDEVIVRGIPFGISGAIYQELLGAAAGEEEAGVLKEYLETLPFYELRQGRASRENAARLCRLCRREGVSAAAARFLAVETALEHGLFLLHDDPAFAAIARVVPELRLWD